MNLDFTIPEILGLIGVASILLAYALLQAGAWTQRNRAYSLVNAVGAGLILFSLAFDPNVPAIAIETCWLLISLFGLWRHRRSRA